MRSVLPIVPFLLAACSGEEGAEYTDTEEALAIVGTYDDAFGTHHEITDTTWTQTFGAYAPYVFAIATFDNTNRLVVAKNDEANDYSGGLWSRFDWLETDDGHLYVCQTAYDAATEEDAAATPRAADDDPANTGCGGFSWTDLTP